MPPVAISPIRTYASNATSAVFSGASLGLYRNNVPSLFEGGTFSIWLPCGGQTSPIAEGPLVVPGVESPLKAVRRRVYEGAFETLADLRNDYPGISGDQISGRPGS